ncbi:MAG: AarF/ABC1/UbiB kinase family protein [Sandaracinaceae bacterium]|nr:AarF/ABC1/UbiB kinase family protein [Sandaracinaceae bacterium]
MSLFVRLVRALFILGRIFTSYLFQLALLKVFRKWTPDPETGREVADMPAWLVRRQARIDDKNAKRLLAGMLSLRGVYIKLGQVLSVMGGFLPDAYARELESLQDAVPPQPWDVMAKAFEDSLGKPPSAVFKSIEREPLAAASLGQVHVAYSADGAKYAVKVLYPGIRDVVRVDLRVVRLGLRLYRMFVPVQNISAVYDALVDLLERETNYVHEAACMSRMAKNFESEEDILFPEVIAEASSAEVLTMTFMEGIKITRFDEYERLGIDRDAVAERLVKCFYRQLFLDRFFHADPHPGNFLVQAGPTPKTPKIVILDFGAISETPQHVIDGMVDVLRGFFEQNDALVLSGIDTLGFVAPDGDRALLEQTVKTYFAKLLKIQDITAGALMRANSKELEALADPEVARRELRGLMKSVRYPDDWFYVERAAVMSFWLIGQLAPDLDAMKIGFPYVLPLLAARTAAAPTAMATAAPAKAAASASASPSVV